MLDADVKAQLKAYLERLVQPIELVANVDDSEGSRDMMDLLRDVAEYWSGRGRGFFVLFVDPGHKLRLRAWVETAA